MAKALPANDVAGAAAEALRDGERASGAGPDPKVDVMKVLERIAAALAALEDSRVPPRPRPRPIAKPDRPASERPRLRHNWG